MDKSPSQKLLSSGSSIFAPFPACLCPYLVCTYGYVSVDTTVRGGGTLVSTYLHSPLVRAAYARTYLYRGDKEPRTSQPNLFRILTIVGLWDAGIPGRRVWLASRLEPHYCTRCFRSPAPSSMPTQSRVGRTNTQGAARRRHLAIELETCYSSCQDT
ncbi:uncharacterized protein LY79DRAFT_567315 [Colletotrichum navitas]|uniref:Uncharacterized protein n=1 Tax=Colletotrichum navitas TaxID=681940 RepID=A0AAD8UYN7_9PEZI|nr:uncharacterized protein LY79DRAFT_567315 [Colletotrichum navitas]KAK1574016.1 hypothetical protein LY79DRAFT_567315 [Colletotrichum navitas]